MDPLSILQNIFSIVQRIRTQTENFTANKNMADRLVLRALCLLEAIKGMKELPKTEKFRLQLKSLEITILEIEVFNKQFLEAGTVKSFLMASAYKKKFQDYSLALSACAVDLNLGMVSQQMSNHEEDRIDEEADHRLMLAQMSDLLKKQEEVLQSIQGLRLGQDDLQALIKKQISSLRGDLLVGASGVSVKKEILSKDQMVNFYDITFQEKIGEGSFGSVYSGSWRGQPVAIKFIERLSTVSEKEQFIREAQIMSRLRSEYIVQFYGACLDEDKLSILMSPMAKGDLMMNLESLAIEDCFLMARNLARGLQYLHEQNVFHGDIKPKNILINQHDEARWADFGLSKTRQVSIASINMTSQSAAWQAPESWQQRSQLTAASDVYSFGMVLWALFTKKLPYDSKTDLEIIKFVKEGGRESLDGIHNEIIKSLIARCWVENPLLRPKASEISSALEGLVREDKEALYNRAVAEHKKNNVEAAYHLYLRAYRNGYKKAATSLGLFLLEGGSFVEKNEAEAKRLLEEGCVERHSRAAYNLGLLYEKGGEVFPVSQDVARLYFEKALEFDPQNTEASDKLREASSKKGLATQATQTDFFDTPASSEVPKPTSRSCSIS